MKINHESGIKWIRRVTDLRFGRPKSSTQAGYRLTFSTEGNAVGKVVRWTGNVGCQFEMGTSKGITRRNFAKNIVIQPYDCGFHYDRILKTERYVNVRVVPLLTLINFYQGVNLEVILKYGNGDISRSSWVSTRSKDGLARVTDHYFDNPQHKYFMESNKTIINYRKEKRLSRYRGSCPHSHESFVAHKVSKTECIFMKNL